MTQDRSYQQYASNVQADDIHHRLQSKPNEVALSVREGFKTLSNVLEVAPGNMGEA